MKKHIYYLIFLGVLSSCSIIFGVKNIDKFNPEKYETVISKLKQKYNFEDIVADTNQYKKVINLGSNNSSKNNLGQPIQILYFDENELKSFHANCFAKGKFTSLNWNTNQRFNEFIPKSAINVNQFGISLKEYSNIFDNINPRKRYTIIIFWTRMFERIALDAIKQVDENLKQFNKKDETIIYLINSDSYFSLIQ